MAAMMMIMGTTATYAKTNPGMKHNNKPAAAVVVNNKHNDHSKFSKPADHCNCKHCTKLNAKIEKEMRRHEEEMRRLNTKKHNIHTEVNSRTNTAGYVGR